VYGLEDYTRIKHVMHALGSSAPSGGPGAGGSTALGE
jgi:hypothetical protein